MNNSFTLKMHYDVYAREKMCFLLEEIRLQFKTLKAWLI